MSIRESSIAFNGSLYTGNRHSQPKKEIRMTTLTLNIQPPKLTLREKVEEIDKFLNRKVSYDQLMTIAKYDYNVKSIVATSLTVLDNIDFSKQVTHVAAYYVCKNGCVGRFFAPVRGSSDQGFTKMYNDIKSSVDRIVFIAGICPDNEDTFNKTNVYLVLMNGVLNAPTNRGQQVGPWTTYQ